LKPTINKTRDAGAGVGEAAHRHCVPCALVSTEEGTEKEKKRRGSAFTRYYHDQYGTGAYFKNCNGLAPYNSFGLEPFAEIA